MRNILTLTATWIVLLCSTVCCTGNNSADTTAETIDSTALRLGVLPTAECLPFYVAAETGVFDSLGLSVRLLTYGAAMDADTAFQKGHIDGVATDLVKAVLWRSKGDSVRLALASDLYLYLVTARQARLKTPQSLKEKIVAFTRNSATDYTADAMLALAKLGSEQLNKPQINDIRLRTQMLMNGQYDGALLPEPYASMAITAGNNLVLDTRNLRHFNPLFAVVVHDSTAHAHQKDIARLVQAYNVVAERIAGSDSVSAAQWIDYLPFHDTFPDSVLLIPTVHRSYKPSNAVVDSVKQWLRGRSLMQGDFKNTDLIP